MSSLNPRIMHIVLFKWTDEATPAAIDAAVQALRDLKTTVPGIIELTCGENFSDRNKGYTHGLVVHFTNRDALEAYGPHPDHQLVVNNHISPIRADVLAVDYELM